MEAVVDNPQYGEITIEWKRYYKKIDDVWLISKFKRSMVYGAQGGMEVSFIFRFDNYEINCDIDDEVFQKDEDDDDDDFDEDEDFDDEEADEDDEDW